MKGIARSEAGVELVGGGGAVVGLHYDQVGPELVRTLVGIVEYGIVEIELEAGQGIGNLHGNILLEKPHRLALVGPVHLHGGVQVLAGKGLGYRQGRAQDDGCQYDVSFHSAESFWSFSSLMFTLSSTSSSIPEGL